MNEIRQTPSRGIQEDDVFKAADGLLSEGLRPTIERVRQKIGRGSPNTVSPMLERWFASLGQRLAGGTVPAAGNDADGVPVSVRNATRLLWETARREAEEVQRGELASARSELQERGNALVEAQAALAQREDAFAQARVSLDSALASSQQARETLERQLKEHAIEAHRVRIGLDDDIKRLTALLSQAGETQQRIRREHAEAVAAKDQDLRQAEARHAAQERRMLAEVDRARQAAKQLEAEAAKEQQRRIQSEEAAALTLEVGRRTLRATEQAAQQLERELRDQLAKQTTLVAQVQLQAEGLQQRLDDLHQQLSEEKEIHERTRVLLATALANMHTIAGARRSSPKKTK
ncbi:hypothetical protein SRS16P2_00159 (plasmid) [Variovorax sp. SRS16]|uniref:DNA-binding protein n=1 Tax=Variovorax sp. SRS16 TaxID=282217 RepID=UPI0013182BF1|nr:DNA-binding protein [Variovorax sp. SRS16]VTU45461.1 hypothetical protein SRS16P2_00159 [Variovorax sp. SRS16]